MKTSPKPAFVALRRGRPKLIAAALIGALALTSAQAAEYPPHIATPDKLESSLGTLEFKDGAPSKETVTKVYDYLDLMHAVEAFVGAYPGASVAALAKGFEAAGIPLNTTAIIWSDLMDGKSLMLTAQVDTIYWWMNLDLSQGPLVVETPPLALGLIDDAWFGWVTDIGLPGPDRGAGGKYLLVPPDYKGELPEGGYFVSKPKTFRLTMLGRAFLDNNDPKGPAAVIKQTLKVYPYKPGGFGSSVGAALNGKGSLARTPQHALDVSFLKPDAQAPVKFVEGTGKVMSTIPPSDFSYFELINEVVQREPAGALDPEIMGHLAAIGIVKSKPFNPDARMKKILTDAAAIGSATGRVMNWDPRANEGFSYYPGSKWTNMLFVGGYTFETPPAEVSSEGEITLQPSDGARKFHSRLAMFYYATAVTPAMVMKLTGIGSQYIMAMQDSKGEYLDGAKTYKVTLPKDIPAERFWSFTVYDNQSRSMLDTPQRFPRAGSQSFPTPAAVPNADGSTTVYFGPTKPKEAGAGNWIQTVPGKGFNMILRCYSPKESFFTKTWRPSEVELVK